MKRVVWEELFFGFFDQLGFFFFELSRGRDSWRKLKFRRDDDWGSDRHIAVRGFDKIENEYLETPILVAIYDIPCMFSTESWKIE